MTDYMENLLNSMSSAFNSSPTPGDGASVIDLNLNEDKTLKWRGLLNNQYARKNSKKSDGGSGGGSGGATTGTDGIAEENFPQAEDHPMDKCKLSQDIDNTSEKHKEEDQRSMKQKRIKRSSNLSDSPSTRLRRSRTEFSESEQVKVLTNDNNQAPPKRRGRSRKTLEPKFDTTELSTSGIEKESDEVRLESNSSPSKMNNSFGRKLRRSDRNASNDNYVTSDIKVEEPFNSAGVVEEMTNGMVAKSLNDMSLEDDGSELSVKGKKTRRSVRLETKDVQDVSSKISPVELDKSLNEEKPNDEINIEQDQKVDLNGIAPKIETNEKPKKRGRKSKGVLQEKPATPENSTDARGTNKKSQRASKDNVDGALANTLVRKEKYNEQPILPSQRPLRRIKPTVKILENEELRYEFESKNIARIVAVNEKSNDADNSRNRKDSKDFPTEIKSLPVVATVKKKLFTTAGNSLITDNIYPRPIPKPCPDPETFLNEIKAAKINLHKSPEDKKLNRKQHRRLLKQKVKLLERLGLKRTAKNDVTDSENSSSDNDEFIPSKKVNVGKPNVTLRVRNSKETQPTLIIQKDRKLDQRRRRNQNKETPPKILPIGIQHEPAKEHNMICLCQTTSQYYTRKTPEMSYCCAIDNVEEQKVGCCNKLEGELLHLLRPSQRVGYMVLCDEHKQRLKSHNCCAGCGMFCTMGKFILCQNRHFFHSECAEKFILNTPYDPMNPTNYTSPTLVLKCPHCGCDTPEKTSLITMKCQTSPVYLPSQKGLISQPAKMSLPVGRPGGNVKRKSNQCTELEKLIPESVMNVVVRESSSSTSNDFTSKDMFYSVNNDDLERVAEIIASGYDVTSEMKEFLNGTCLHLVAHFGTIQMAYLLLSRDSSTDFLDMTDKELRTAAMCAIIGDKCDILKLFIQCGANIFKKGPDGMTCLHFSAKQGNFPATQIIVETYKDSVNISNFDKFINAPDDGGWTAIVWAAENGFTDIVSFLINHGADTNVCDTENNTVLHWATLSNREETISVLLQTNINCSIQNINGDTPLHIACRQSSTRVCLMLIANGADLMVKNKAQELPYDCIPDEEDQCARVVGFNMQMKSFGASGLQNRIACSDISNGRESHPIQVVRRERLSKVNGDIDDETMLPDFKYISKTILLQNSVQIDYRVSQMRICSCNDGCNSENCQCSTISVQNWYTPEGRLSGEFNFEDPAMIFECNDVCGCNKLLCKNRVVQNGIKAPLQVFECEQRLKGWGVRSLRQILRGTFVAEYTGEILTDMEADRRTDDSYFFGLGSSEHCIDANYYGNVSRFFNHSCTPNIVPVRVYFDHQDYRFPKIAFFACKDIEAGEELAFDYGEKFWAVKQKYFECKCETPNCRYSSAAKCL